MSNIYPANLDEQTLNKLKTSAECYFVWATVLALYITNLGWSAWVFVGIFAVLGIVNILAHRWLRRFH